MNLILLAILILTINGCATMDNYSAAQFINSLAKAKDRHRQNDIRNSLRQIEINTRRY